MRRTIRCPHGFDTQSIRCTQCGSPAPAAVVSRRNNVVDLTGQTFAGAVVLSRAANNNNGATCWHCRLPCGHTKTISAPHLRQQQKLGGRIRCEEGCSVYVRNGRVAS
jgi:hypothetical protein